MPDNLRVVQTRYRDIPFEEVACAKGLAELDCCSRPWSETRGTAIFIRIPADNHPIRTGCTEPRYRVVDNNGNPLTNSRGQGVSVCPHAVEIGD